MSENDINLIRRIILYNDHKAFDILIDKHQSAVRNLFFKMTSGNKALTDDLSQEVFIRVFRHLKSYNSTAQFSTWIYKVALNVFYDHKRKMRYSEEIISDNSICEEESIDNKIDVVNALGVLNDKEKAAIILQYEKGFSHSEIAKIMKLPIGTVKTNILRGKAKLKEYFKYE
jgi:RNA polymerase sigma-70 factor (ECF subfamily)